MENETDLATVFAASQQKQRELRAKLDEEKQKLAFERQKRQNELNKQFDAIRGHFAILKRHLDPDSPEYKQFRIDWVRTFNEAVTYSGKNIYGKKPAA